MKWYQSLIKRVLNGIILFLLPVFLLLFILGKAITIVQKLILPIKKYLPAERVFGVGLLTLISLVLILFICYLAGMLIERKKVKRLITKLEDKILVFIPGYSMIKAQTSEIVSEAVAHWQPVLIGEDGDWKMGMLVDRQPDGLCMIFFPEPPDAKQGEMKLVHESKLKKLDMPVNKMIRIIRKYGKSEGAFFSKDEK
ncbi:MAG TPA: hypothetical protein VK492_06945 [Chitinophagaceae bacterium]|nr:hypothetical protein [Chitinophagaceae bacterium]